MEIALGGGELVGSVEDRQRVYLYSQLPLFIISGSLIPHDILTQCHEAC